MNTRQPSVTEFYTNKTILLTGTTGFLGKVVFEKILRSLPSVRTIYLAIAPRGDKDNEIQNSEI
jgi:FlaA1/EpsC-like NDP-sugar epimerase